jgi:hypothetical protein
VASTIGRALEKPGFARGGDRLLSVQTPSLRHTCIELALDLACTPITGRLAVADGPSRPFGG